MISRTASDDAYTFHPGAQSQTYVANGLNQYSSVSGTSFSYDTNGNLTSDGVRSFTYDIDNHMLSGSAPYSMQIGYDPLGRRMWALPAGGTYPAYTIWSGGQAVEAYSDGVVTGRYVPSGVSQTPLIWYAGAGESSPGWLHLDNQGAPIAYSNSGDTILN